MWHLGTWFSDGFGSVRLLTRVKDLRDLFQPKPFYDPMILRYFPPSHPLHFIVPERIVFLDRFDTDSSFCVK